METIGVVEISFSYKDMQFKIFDVGGRVPENEQKKLTKRKIFASLCKFWLTRKLAKFASFFNDRQNWLCSLCEFFSELKFA
jgi:hypothetical protein